MPTDLLQAAAAELHGAADTADTLAGSDPFNPWTPVAGHLRLVAAQLHPAAPTIRVPVEDPATQIRRARHVLAGIRTEAPADLTQIRAEVERLARLADTLAGQS